MGQNVDFTDASVPIQINAYHLKLCMKLQMYQQTHKKDQTKWYVLIHN